MRVADPTIRNHIASSRRTTGTPAPHLAVTFRRTWLRFTPALSSFPDMLLRWPAVVLLSKSGNLWITVIAAVEFAKGIFVSLLCGHAGPVSILRVVVLDSEAHIVEVA